MLGFGPENKPNGQLPGMEYAKLNKNEKQLL